MKNFEPRRFMGVWYNQAEVQAGHEVDCQRVTLVQMPGRIGSYEDGVLKGPLGLVTKRIDELSLFRLAESGRRERRAELTGNRKNWFNDVVRLGRDPNFFVMATDYRNYAITYECVERKGRREQVTLLTRKPIIPSSLRNFMYRLAFQMNLPVNRLREVDHNRCRDMHSIHSFEYREKIDELRELRIRRI